MASSGSDPDTKTDSVERKCGLDVTYCTSIHGILKAKQIGWSFLAFILACFAGAGPFVILFILVTFFGFFSILVVWFMFATHMYKKIKKINWFVADIIVSVVAAILYVSFGLPLIIKVLCPLCIAAGVFGFVAVASFAVGAWFSFKRWQENKQRQTSDSRYAVDY